MDREAITFDDILLRPQKSLPSRQDVDTSVQLHPNLSLAIPIMSSNMDTVTEYEMMVALAKQGGIGILHRFMSIEDQIEQVVNARGIMPEEYTSCRVGATIGVTGDWKERAGRLLDEEVDLMVVDVANAYSDAVAEVIQWLKEHYDSDFQVIMAGNVATAEGARFLRDAGADIIKIGIGPGLVCSTRIVTGCGVPQITAIQECSREVKKNLYAPWSEGDIAIVADGGIRCAGDIIKALAAGADAVMIGNLLAGTDEAPGEVIQRDGRKYKVYRGMASKEAAGWNGTDPDVAPEGVNTLVPCKGPASEVIRNLVLGIKSGCSYQGCDRLPGLRKAEFIRVSHAGYIEGLPQYREP